MKLAIITAHAGADSLGQAINSWLGEREAMREPDWRHDHGFAFTKTNPPVFVVDGETGMLPAYQSGLLHVTADILAFLHDDAIIRDPEWSSKVLAEFEDPKVGLVGFGGALGHGSPELYKVPYDYHQLGRSQFLSNMDDAEVHGKRFTGACDVAVLDGFALIVRRKILEKADGWPIKELSVNDTPVGLHHCYDYWLCCMTRRLGYRIRVVGIACQHLGGRTFVKLGLGKGPEHWEQFLAAHEYIYNEFKDVLPFHV